MSEPSTIDFDRENHIYSRDGVVIPSVTQIIAGAGKCSWDYVTEDIRIHSMKRGRSVHWLTQLEDQGALNYRTVPKHLRGYRLAWNRWKEATGFEVRLIEHAFISPFGFAGTLDRSGSFRPNTMYRNSTFAIIDLKSGPIAEWVKMQLAAYTLGIEPRPAVARTIRRIAVRLSPDGTYSVKEFPRESYDSDLAEFMECLRRKVTDDPRRSAHQPE